jgi:hypothetical protein
MGMVKERAGICIALGNQGRVGMTRAIVDQKLNALLSVEARLERTERTSPQFDEICARYRNAEGEYNEAFDAWWFGDVSQSL